MIDLDDITFIASGLKRPECVLTHESGLLFAADWTGSGGVAVISPAGAVRRIEADRPVRPNGIALEPGGTFLLAELGAETGGVFRLHPDGAVEPVVTKLDGRPLPPTNYAHRDTNGRLWITVSTRRKPRDLGYRADVDDGFIVLADARGVRIVADRLGYTNECLVAPDGAHLYVNETFTRRLSRFPIAADGTLGPKEVVASFGAGTYPDGLTFDAEEGVWITSIVSNRVIRIAPDGGQDVMVEDADADHIAWTEQAYRAGELGRPHLDTPAGRRLRNISSLAFGGKDLRTAYLGCLLGDSIACFDSLVAGHPPVHWTHPLGIAVLPGDGIGEEVVAPCLRTARSSDPACRRRDAETMCMPRPAPSTTLPAARPCRPKRSRSAAGRCHPARRHGLARGPLSRRHRDRAAARPALRARPVCRRAAGPFHSRHARPAGRPARQASISCMIRESTEGLFASRGKGVVESTIARRATPW
jgi:sugar lactone lactonase YvrE